MNLDIISVSNSAIIVPDDWQRIYTETLADGTIREVHGKMNGTSGDTKVIEYKISTNE